MFKNILMIATISLIAHLGLNAEIDTQTVQQKRSENYNMKLQQGAESLIAKSDKDFNVTSKSISEFASTTDESFDLKPSKKQFARAK